MKPPSEVMVLSDIESDERSSLPLLLAPLDTLPASFWEDDEDLGKLKAAGVMGVRAGDVDLGAVPAEIVARRLSDVTLLEGRSPAFFPDDELVCGALVEADDRPPEFRREEPWPSSSTCLRLGEGWEERAPDFSGVSVTPRRRVD